jgi:hypothetical protein
MRQVSRWICALGFVVLGVVATGCGNDGRLKTYPVKGQVLYNGEPLKGVDVAFIAVEEKNRVPYPPHATTDAQGNFTLMSYDTGDGAPAGEFQVAVAFAVEVSGPDDGSDQSKKIIGQVPVKYHKAETSGLKATVNTSSTTLEPFKLEGPPIRSRK